MRLTTETIGEVTVVALPGDHLDAGLVEEFKRDIAPLLEGRGRVVFDLSALRFVDSAGIGALLSCLRRMTGAGGDLKLFGLAPAVRATFDLARMHRIFDTYDTKEAAVAAFEG